MDTDHVSSWVDRYVTAWNTNARADIEDLFTQDAVYLTGPFDDPWKGRDAIVAGWLEDKDEPGTTEFSYEVIAVDGDLGIVEGRTRYLDSETDYANLWFIRLKEDGRATSFTEWWIKKV